MLFVSASLQIASVLLAIVCFFKLRQLSMGASFFGCQASEIFNTRHTKLLFNVAGYVTVAGAIVVGFDSDDIHCLFGLTLGFLLILQGQQLTGSCPELLSHSLLGIEW